MRQILKISLSVMSIALASCDVIDKDKLNSITGPRVTCASPAKILTAGESATLSYGFANMSPSPLNFGVGLDDDPSLFFKDWGSVTAGATATSVEYTSPGVFNNPLLIPIQAEAVARSIPGSCKVLFVAAPSNSIGLKPEDTISFENPLATVYRIPPGAVAVPDIAGLTPLMKFPLKTINTTANWGISDLSTDFAVRIVGKLVVNAPGSHILYLNASRGGVLWLDGVRQIDNGGNHGQVSVSKTLTLTAGSHDLMLDAYNNAAQSAIVVVFQWDPPDAAFGIVPASALKY